MNEPQPITGVHECFLVEPKMIAAFWHEHYWPLIERALDEAVLVPDFEHLIYQRLLSGEDWLVQIDGERGMQALSILEQQEIKEGAVLHVHTLAGANMDSWLLEFVDFLAFFAKGMGLRAVTCTGRMGWAKVLRNYGFKPQYISMRMGIEYEYRGQCEQIQQQQQGE